MFQEEKGGAPVKEDMVIASRKNEMLRRASRLLSSAEARRESGVFLAEGARFCRDAARSGISIKQLYYTEAAAEKYPEYLQEIRCHAEQVFQLAEHAAPLLSDTKRPQGIFCVCEMKGQSSQRWVPAREHTLLLEQMQDPGNLGAVFRTAEALGIGTIVLCGESCDVYSPKVLRASMGAVFRLNAKWVPSLKEACDLLKKEGIPVYAAVPDSAAVPVTSVDFSRPSAMAVGNEGNGLSREGIEACTQTVTIPMAGRAESLNAAPSAAIWRGEMVRGGGSGLAI